MATRMGVVVVCVGFGSIVSPNPLQSDVRVAVEPLPGWRQNGNCGVRGRVTVNNWSGDEVRIRIMPIVPAGWSVQPELLVVRLPRDSSSETGFRLHRSPFAKTVSVGLSATVNGEAMERSTPVKFEIEEPLERDGMHSTGNPVCH